DRLPQEEQAALLENEKMAWHLLFGQTGAPRHVALTEQTSDRLRQIETQLVRWQTLPEPRREQILRNFRRVYSPTNQVATPQWPQLPAEERAQTEESLKQFRSLAPAQREHCVSNFPRFAELSPADRRQFLLNTEKWRQFKPEEREAWRKL